MQSYGSVPRPSSMDEKTLVLPSTSTPSTPSSPSPARKRSSAAVKSALLLFLAVTTLTLIHPHFHHFTHPGPAHKGTPGRPRAVPLAIDESACYQPKPLTPKTNVLGEVEDLYTSDEFVEKAAGLLGDAVRVNTELFDGWAEVGEAPEWEKFYAFHAYLNKSFPLVHKHLKRETVNTFALIYTFEGTDKSLKPLMLTGHQDTVPVERTTVSQWKEGPFSGKYDGTYVWGRGSCDDKSGTVGIMTALETLLSVGFKPKRTIIFASGMDEEGSGPRGAGHLAGIIEERYGKDGIAMIVDEGNGYNTQYGVAMASPAVGEKGQGNIQIDVETPGGHSSVPPDHTSIGYLSLLIAKIEANLHAPLLIRENPYFSQLTCGAKFGTEMEKSTRGLIESAQSDDEALKELGDMIGKSRYTRGMVTTTQAVDLIQGGQKVNALPERVTATINHRINVASSYQELEQHLIDLLSPLIAEYDLELEAFGKHYSLNTTSPSVGLVKMNHWAVRKPLNPAPISPTGKGEAPWELLSGVIKSAYAARRGAEHGEKEIIVSPGISTGNTDTKYYWNLTKNIFRYGHGTSSNYYTPNGVHSVNEAIKATGFVEIIRFLTRLILAADEAESL